MTAFATGIRAIFLDPNQATDGVYTDVSGIDYPVRVVPARVETIDPLLGAAGSRQPAALAEVLQEELPSQPLEGETLRYTPIGASRAKTFVIRGSDPDTLHIIWRLDLDPV